MKSPSEGMLLRVFIGESDRHEGRPLYEVLVDEARKRGLAGATVWKGFMGFGAHSRMHTAKILARAQDLPIVLEIVDASEKIEEFLPVLDGLVAEGLVTVEPARIILYRAPQHPRA